MRKSGTVMSLVSVALAVPVVFGSCSEDNGLTPTDKGDGKLQVSLTDRLIQITIG